MTTYDREALALIIAYHYRKDIGSCGCGWSELGKSHPHHILDVYELEMKAREIEPEAWVVWNSYSWNSPETFDNEADAIEAFEEICKDTWVSSATLTHRTVIRSYKKEES